MTYFTKLLQLFYKCIKLDKKIEKKYKKSIINMYTYFK